MLRQQKDDLRRDLERHPDDADKRELYGNAEVEYELARLVEWLEAVGVHNPLSDAHKLELEEASDRLFFFLNC